MASEILEAILRHTGLKPFKSWRTDCLLSSVPKNETHKRMRKAQMANLSNVQLARFNEAKSSIRCAIDWGIKEGHTQKEILSKARAWINGYVEYSPKNWPKHYASALHNYLDGYWDASVKDKTIFLYFVDGKFYTTRASQKFIDLPSWDTLPREMWDKLGEHGGIYWKDSLKPFYV